MNAHLKILAAAAISVGTMSIGYAQSNTATGSENQVQSAADRAGDETNRAADKTGAALDNAADRTGNTAQSAADRTGNAADKAVSGQGIHGTAEAPDAEGIRDVLASTTEATLKGSFSDIVERFVDADRNRLGEAMPSDDDLKPFNDLKEQFRNDWQDKYNQEFDIEKEELVFNPSVKIRQGEFGETEPDRARTAGERTDASDDAEDVVDRNTTEGETGVGRALDRTGDAIGKAADATGDALTSGVDRAREAGADPDANREPGRNNATVMIPAREGLPAINVPLIHELPDSWRIDIPDKLDAATLQTNLQKHLSKAHQQKGQWPADANEAYLNVAHHVLLAIFEGTPHVQEKGAGSSAQPAADTTPPAQQPATPAQPQ